MGASVREMSSNSTPPRGPSSSPRPSWKTRFASRRSKNSSASTAGDLSSYTTDDSPERHRHEGEHSSLSSSRKATRSRRGMRVLKNLLPISPGSSSSRTGGSSSSSPIANLKEDVFVPVEQHSRENGVEPPSAANPQSDSPKPKMSDKPASKKNTETKTDDEVFEFKDEDSTMKQEHLEIHQKQQIKERDGFCRRVDSYDGQVIVVDEKPTYELGNYLGGGVAGVVYEGHRLRPIEDYPVRTGHPTDSVPMVITEEIVTSSATSVTSFLCAPGNDATAPASKSVITMRPDSKQPITNEGAKSSGVHAMAMDFAIETTDAGSGDHQVVLVDGIDAPSRSRHYTRAASLHGEDADAPFPVYGLQDETVAIKILNPVGFRMLAPDAIQTAVIVKEGEAMEEDVIKGLKPMTDKHVWWVINPNSRNLRTLQRYKGSNSMPLESSTMNGGSSPVRSSKRGEVDRGSPEKGLRLSLVAAYMDPKTCMLRELPLTRCIEIWGHVPFSASDVEFEEMMKAIERVNAGQMPPPSIPILAKNKSSPPPSRVDTEYSAASLVSTDDSSTLNSPVALASSRTGLYRAAAAARSTMYCAALNAYIAVPAVPPKYLRWLRQRRAATKEIRNMMLIGRHKNVVHLYEVLELIQDSKSTMFLILELVTGGELFDLISSSSVSKVDDMRISAGWDESEFRMRKFFFELASGIYYCHSNGIAHRDLKPENLLVHNGPGDECTLKIADFGLSATFNMTNTAVSDLDTVAMDSLGSPTSSPGSLRGPFVSPSSPSPLDRHAQSSPIKSSMNSISALGAQALSLLTCGAMEDVLCAPNDIDEEAPPSPLKRMTSVVGSPHYVAPEIISQSDEDGGRSRKPSGPGYDGTKADVWSAGVILYAMLFRSLPFGEDLLRCPRYQSFSKWYEETRTFGGRRSTGAAALNPVFTDADEHDMLGPHWFFPAETSRESRDLIVAMLNPDPVERLSIEMVLQHPWILKE